MQFSPTNMRKFRLCGVGKGNHIVRAKQLRQYDVKADPPQYDLESGVPLSFFLDRFRLKTDGYCLLGHPTAVLKVQWHGPTIAAHGSHQ